MVLVARDDPLDTYLVQHPEVVFGKAVDAVVIDPGNPYVLAGHLCAAAAEVPFTDDDFAHFPEFCTVHRGPAHEREDAEEATWRVVLGEGGEPRGPL